MNMHLKKERDQDLMMRKKSETMSEIDSMETDGHPQDILSEPDSEESEFEVGPELLDIITGIGNGLDYILKMRKQFLKALERYDEIDNDEKKGIIEKYVKLKGKLWGELCNFKEEEDSKNNEEVDGEEENDGGSDEEEENEEEGEEKG
jgi:hypothetical protein